MEVVVLTDLLETYVAIADLAAILLREQEEVAGHAPVIIADTFAMKDPKHSNKLYQEY
jgi:hypothetical protein